MTTFTVTLEYLAEKTAKESFVTSTTDYDEAIDAARQRTKSDLNNSPVRHVHSQMVKTRQGNNFDDIIIHQLYMGGHPYEQLRYHIRWIEEAE